MKFVYFWRWGKWLFERGRVGSNKGDLKGEKEKVQTKSANKSV
jgi:hypothetical protein